MLYMVSKGKGRREIMNPLPQIRYQAIDLNLRLNNMIIIKNSELYKP